MSAIATRKPAELILENGDVIPCSYIDLGQDVTVTFDQYRDDVRDSVNQFYRVLHTPKVRKSSKNTRSSFPSQKRSYRQD